VTTSVLVRCASVAAWTTATLRGEAGVEQALDVLHRAGIDPTIWSVKPGEQQSDLRYALAVGEWRTRGVTGWRYVPVAPGDASGLPGPAGFRNAAIDAGVALVSVGDTDLGLVPSASRADTALPRDLHLEEMITAGSGLASPESLAELDRSLLLMLGEAIDTFDELDLTHWNDDVDDLRVPRGAGVALPPGAPPRAQHLATRSQRVLELIDLALPDHGGSRTAADMAVRGATLQQLGRVARAAHAAAWNTGLIDPDRRR
jgi:hypothetical protein